MNREYIIKLKKRTYKQKTLTNKKSIKYLLIDLKKKNQ